MSRRPGFLRRSAGNEARRKRQARDEERAAGAAFRWAAIGVAIVMVLAVTVGFGGNPDMASRIAGLAFLGKPILFGVTLADFLAVLLMVGIGGGFLYREWRRANR